MCLTHWDQITRKFRKKWNSTESLADFPKPLFWKCKNHVAVTLFLNSTVIVKYICKHNNIDDTYCKI